MRRWAAFLMWGSAALGVQEPSKLMWYGLRFYYKRNTQITKWQTFTSFSGKKLTRIKMKILVQNESFKSNMTQQPSQTTLTCTGLGLDLGWKVHHYHLFYSCMLHGWDFLFFSKWGLFKLVTKLVQGARCTFGCGNDVKPWVSWPELALTSSCLAV